MLEEDTFSFRVEQVGPIGLDLEVEELDGAIADLVTSGLDLRKEADKGALNREGIIIR